MIKKFESIIFHLIRPGGEGDTFSIFDPLRQFDENPTDDAGIARTLNAAFLVALAGGMHHASEEAGDLLTFMAESPQWGDIARFYLNGLDSVKREIEVVCGRDPDFKERLETLSEWMITAQACKDSQETAEKIWELFFPEANGILNNEGKSIKTLRAKRKVTITEQNPNPVTDPAGQVLFTSNVLLTIPPSSSSIEKLPFSDRLCKKLLEVSREPQLYWYDHPIQIGVKPEQNEILYGLKGLETAFGFERKRGNISPGTRPVCLLSVSVTHRGLQDIAKQYLEEELAGLSRYENIDIYLFTEVDTGRIINEVLAPAADHYLGPGDEKEIFNMFGVDGEYGRHYSFLKAIAAFWNVLIKADIKATFKIDLDQIFPQEALVEQSGCSAFEHLRTPLWGAKGLDFKGRPLELGMIAGALVNERDMSKSLFTPDVLFPSRRLEPDQYIFFSTLPQALSTEAEMMTRYNTEDLDGQRRCIQRIHVTGGTNGILVESLRRHRPFTPSFISRAEDQAYLFSALSGPGIRLAYVHKDGLIMRHDKDTFAQEAIQSAHVAKIIGDYVRIIYFSAYAHAITDRVERLKDIIDPFTGCFVSRIPVTAVLLRFGLKAASIFLSGKNDEGIQFIKMGAARIMKALHFTDGENSPLKQQYEKERLSWNLYYDTISAMEKGLKGGDPFARSLQKKARDIIHDCAVHMK